MINIFYLLAFICFIYILCKILFSKKCPYCECKYCSKTPDYYLCNVCLPSEIAIKKAKHKEYGNVCYNCFFLNKNIKSTL